MTKKWKKLIMKMILKILTQRLRIKKHSSWEHGVKLGEDLAEIMLIAQDLLIETQDKTEDSLHTSHQIMIDFDKE